MICENKPLISIALCTYNGEKYIEKQLDSLVSQSYTPIEIVISDDSSTDGTWNILEKYAAVYPFIKLFKSRINLGFTKNFEQAISFCNGDFIALSDQDDIWDIDKLSILYNELGDSDLIYHDSNFIDENDNPILGKKMSDHYNTYDGSSNLPFLISNCAAGHAMMFKKTLTQKFLPFKDGYYHDWWIIFVAATFGKIKSIPDVLVRYRQHDLSITDSLSLKATSTMDRNKGYLNFNLNWIEHCLTLPNIKNKEEIEIIYKQLKSYKEGSRGMKLFIFLLRYYHLLFYFHIKNKSFISRLNLIRKISFG